MPAKKKKTKEPRKELLTVKANGGTADGRGNIYTGHLGGHNIGSVVAKNQTEARKKLLTCARKLLK